MVAVPEAERSICDAFYRLAIFIYDYEKELSGAEYLTSPKVLAEETPKKLLETIQEVENSTFADFSV